MDNGPAGKKTASLTAGFCFSPTSLKKTIVYPKRRLPSFAAFIVLLASFSGCGLLQNSITYFDSTTYKNLTGVKPRIVFLYETFSDDSIAIDEVKAIRLQLAQMLEYEKGKGQKNSETAQQIKIIRDMFEDDIQHRMTNGKWSTAQRENQTENISDAFDLAISTERLKNKNE